MIENNKIVNTIIVDSIDVFPNLIDVEKYPNAQMGWDVVDGVPTPPLKTFDELKAELLNTVNTTYNSTAPVTVNGTTYNGGDSSASAIAGAVQLAQALGETDVKLWDIDNVVGTYTFDEAMNIAAQIAKAYRDKQFTKYELIAKINACESIEELEAIVL